MELKKEIYNEANGLHYTLGEDGFYYPNLVMPECEYHDIGKYGRLHQRYLEENHRVIYYNLLVAGKLNQRLHEVDVHAQEQVEMMVKAMAKVEGCDEALKMRDQMKWVGLMNNYKACAEEVVLKEIVYV